MRHVRSAEVTQTCAFLARCPPHNHCCAASPRPSSTAASLPTPPTTAAAHETSPSSSASFSPAAPQTYQHAHIKHQLLPAYPHRHTHTGARANVRASSSAGRKPTAKPRCGDWRLCAGLLESPPSTRRGPSSIARSRPAAPADHAIAPPPHEQTHQLPQRAPPVRMYSNDARPPARPPAARITWRPLRRS